MSKVATHALEIMPGTFGSRATDAPISEKKEKKASIKERFAARAERKAHQAKSAAFQQEAIPHMDSLYNFALRLSGTREDANDLLQETYLKAFRFFDKFQKGTNCKAWLFRIMKNSYINRYRKAQKTPESVDYDTVSDFYHSIRPDGAEGNDLQRDVFNNLLTDEVVSAVDRLPSDFRTVVILCDIEDFTYEEIAEFVDCPVGTVRSRLHRGRRLLREYLGSYAQENGYASAAMAA